MWGLRRCGLELLGGGGAQRISANGGRWHRVVLVISDAYVFILSHLPLW